MWPHATGRPFARLTLNSLLALFGCPKCLTSSRSSRPDWLADARRDSRSAIASPNKNIYNPHEHHPSPQPSLDHQPPPALSSSPTAASSTTTLSISLSLIANCSAHRQLLSTSPTTRQLLSSLPRLPHTLHLSVTHRQLLSSSPTTQLLANYSAPCQLLSSLPRLPLHSPSLCRLLPPPTPTPTPSLPLVHRHFSPHVRRHHHDKPSTIYRHLSFLSCLVVVQ
jgi:hypothetical protein